MRDTSEGMTEFVDLKEDQSGQQYLIIAHDFDKRRYFRIALQKEGFMAMRQIFDFTPFDPMNRQNYKRFWSGSLAYSKDGTCAISVRYEQGTAGKSFDMKVPKALVENFKWLYNTRMEYEKIKYLEILP